MPEWGWGAALAQSLKLFEGLGLWDMGQVLGFPGPVFQSPGEDGAGWGVGCACGGCAS